jgi:hypothetical protein
MRERLVADRFQSARLAALRLPRGIEKQSEDTHVHPAALARQVDRVIDSIFTAPRACLLLVRTIGHSRAPIKYVSL